MFYQLINHIYFNIIYIYLCYTNPRITPPITAEISFILLLIFGYFVCKKPITEFFKKIDKKIWLMLLLIFLTGLSLRLFVSSHQIIEGEDEISYIQTAKNFLSASSLARPERAIGWSLILAIAFKLFGLSLGTAFYTSSVLGALTIFNIFFIAFLLSKKEEIALYSALLFAILPLHIFWSGSAETNVPSLFFLTLSLFFCLLYLHYYKKPEYNDKLLWLSLFSLVFASQFRIENFIIFFIFSIGALVLNFPRLKKLDFRFIPPLMIVLVLIIPHFLYVLDWNLNFPLPKESNRFGIENLIYGSMNYGKYLLNNSFHPWILSILYLGGLIYLFFKQRRIFLFLISWFLLFYLIYFTSWFGSPETVGSMSRIFLNFYMPIVISSGYLIYFLRKYLESRRLGKTLTIILFLIILLPFPMSIKRNNNYFTPLYSHEAETEIIKLAEKEVPKDCLVVANSPRMLVTTNLEVIDVDWWEEHKYAFSDSECLLFFKDYTCCDSWKASRPDYLINCAKMEKYDSVPFLIHSEKDYTFGFYKILDR